MKAGGSVKSHGWALESHLMALERACRAGSGREGCGEDAEVLKLCEVEGEAKTDCVN